ncbi:MAG TPA: hypothetical protein VMF05_08205 [Stellaceae bacterium]|nr:hypothetical protein [Stellaceae bacterium]
MPTVDEIAQEKQRISERLARLDAERAKLADELNELEIAERVLSRFGKAAATERRRRGRPVRTAPSGREHRSRSPAPVNGPSVSDATLQVVETHRDGLTAAEIQNCLSRDFGLTVRPNHLGIALQRHRRAGRLESRDERWYPPQTALAEMPSQAMTG